MCSCNRSAKTAGRPHAGIKVMKNFWIGDGNGVAYFAVASNPVIPWNCRIGRRDPPPTIYQPSIANCAVIAYCRQRAIVSSIPDGPRRCLLRKRISIVSGESVNPNTRTDEFSILQPPNTSIGLPVTFARLQAFFRLYLK